MTVCKVYWQSDSGCDSPDTLSRGLAQSALQSDYLEIAGGRLGIDQIYSAFNLRLSPRVGEPVVVLLAIDYKIPSGRHEE